MIEIIGKENVQLSSKQVDELLELLDKEEILEVEDKIEKALKREIEAKMSAVAHPDAGVVPPPSVATPTTSTPSDSTTSTTTAAPKADETKKTSTADPNDASKKGYDSAVGTATSATSNNDKFKVPTASSMPIVPPAAVPAKQATPEPKKL